MGSDPRTGGVPRKNVVVSVQLGAIFVDKVCGWYVKHVKHVACILSEKWLIYGPQTLINQKRS
jgi:hypothetical protein